MALRKQQPPKEPVVCPLGAAHEQHMISIDKKIDEVHTRVFNGLAKEIREEVRKEISSVRSKVWAVALAILLAFAGLIIEGRFSSNQVSDAIHSLEKSFATHTHNTDTGIPNQ